MATPVVTPPAQPTQPVPQVPPAPVQSNPDASGTVPSVPPEVTPAAPDVPAASDVPAAVDVQKPAAPTAVELPEPNEPAAAEPVVEAPPATTQLAFTPFSETDKMIWPVEGEIAKLFSGNKLIFDPTYHEYATNDDLRISAQEGTPVKAAAGGQVVDIGYNMNDGNYVTIDHGNGYVATYGQLMEAVLVSNGEVVAAGQYIGGVGEPSPGGSLNGTHVNLRVAKEDEAIDPLTLLAVNE
jgi:murein DD-endopeptidase MepM/ murein hydrolase activator NlpD